MRRSARKASRIIAGVLGAAAGATLLVLFLTRREPSEDPDDLRTTASLIEALRSEDAGTRRAALERLARPRRGDEEDIPALLAAIESLPSATGGDGPREEAVRALLRRGGGIVEDLAAALRARLPTKPPVSMRKKGRTSRRGAARALARAGPKGLGALAAALHAPSREARITAAWGLGLAGRGASGRAPELMAALEVAEIRGDSDEEILREILGTFGKLGAEASPTVLQGLASRHLRPETKAALVDVLATTRAGAPAAETLARLVLDRAPSADGTLPKPGGIPWTSELIEKSTAFIVELPGSTAFTRSLLRSGRGEVERAALRALETEPEKAADLLREIERLLERSAEETRVLAALALAAIGEPARGAAWKVLRLLEGALSTEKARELLDEKTRRALGPSARARSAARRRVSSPRVATRRGGRLIRRRASPRNPATTYFSSLVTLRPEATPLLFAAVSGHDPRRRLIALAVILELEEVIPPLRETLLGLLGAEDVSLRAAAAAALARSGIEPRETAAALIRSLGGELRSSPKPAYIRKDSDASRLRIVVQRALQVMDPAAALPPVLEALEADDWRLRHFAIQVLEDALEAAPGDVLEPAVAALARSLVDERNRFPVEDPPAEEELREAGFTEQEISDWKAWRRSVRSSALALLRNLGPRASPVVPELVELLDDPELATAIVYALGALGPEAGGVARPLFRRLLPASRDPERGAEAEVLSKAIVRHGPAAIAAIVEVARDEGEPARKPALLLIRDILASSSPRRTLRGRVVAARSPRRTARGRRTVSRRAAATAEAAGGEASEEETARREALLQALPLILESLEDASPEVRELALSLLEHTGLWSESVEAARRRRIAALVAGCLEDEERDVRLRAAQTLAVLGEHARGAAPAVVDALATEVREKDPASDLILELNGDRVPWRRRQRGRPLPNPDLFVALQRACRSLGSASVEPLLELLRETDGHGNLRHVAVFLIREIAPPPEVVLPALVVALASDAASVREAASEALAARGPDALSAAPALARAVGEESRRLRSAGTEDARETSLRLIGRHLETLVALGKGSFPELVRTLSDPSALVRVRALDALASLDAPREELVAATASLLDDPALAVRRHAASVRAALAEKPEGGQDTEQEREK